MNNTIRQLAEQAGFCLWQNESWGPGPGHIDWSAEYTDEFRSFIELLAAHIESRCAELQAQTGVNFSAEYSAGRQMGMEVLKNYLIQDLLREDSVE
jgi:hypothetical protein